MIKEKTAWHITTATHNSRYSKRMADYKVKLGASVWLSEKEEIIVTEVLAEIVQSDKLNIPAYNICGDHLHILLVCDDKELSKIVGKIKSMTARACNIAMDRTITTTARGHAPLSSRGNTQVSLWTEKFGRKKIICSEQYNLTLDYIVKNRLKHQLPENIRLQQIIDSFTCRQGGTRYI